MQERADWNMVLLRHEVAGGSWHFDWMLDLGGAAGMAGVSGGDGGLVTFRVWESPEGVAVGESIRAEPLKHHRREYLTFEGEISGGRGRVTRERSGRARLISDGPEALEFEAVFEGGEAGWWSVPRAGTGTVVVAITRFA